MGDIRKDRYFAEVPGGVGLAGRGSLAMVALDIASSLSAACQYRFHPGTFAARFTSLHLG